MKDLQFKVERVDVLNEVHKVTNYEAQAIKPTIGQDGNAIELGEYEKMATDEPQEEILNSYWFGASARLMEQLRDFDGFVQSRSDEFEVALVMPDNWDDNCQKAVEDGCKDTLVADIVSQWMSHRDVAKVEYYTARSKEYLATVKSLLFKRLRPKHNTCYENGTSITLC